MITEIQIKNYKSIQKLKLSLGRVTVFIGENGCGKSNILESIALASAAANDKLDNEFLSSRGIRVSEPEFMRSAFDRENIIKEIKIDINGDGGVGFDCLLQHDNQPYSNWRMVNSNPSLEDSLLKALENEFGFETANKHLDFVSKISKAIQKSLDESVSEIANEHTEPANKGLQDLISKISNRIKKGISKLPLKDFLIYSPENTSLRTFEREGQVQPLGINGEGLFKLLKVLSSDENPDKINEIKEKLKLIDWFQDFEISLASFEPKRSIQIKDRYLDESLSYFDQKSSNEGFLFLMFYFALFVSSDTPSFFSIDNIDASLNPKLCSRLVKELVELAKKYDKQVILTTHNPAILDGLNLDDDEQRLLAIYRNKDGHTKAKRILKPEPLEGQQPVKLSEAFMRGYIGGLPKGF